MSIQDDNVGYYTALDELTPAGGSVKKKKLLSRLWFRIVVGLLVGGGIFCSCILALFLIGWFSLGSELWESVFAVEPESDCNVFRANRPYNYTINFNCPYLVEPLEQWKSKLAPYYVNESSYETVVFKSRDADWIPGGIGTINIVGTLFKQPSINSNSKFIITVHGYTSCRYRYETMLASTMLYKMGFNVLQIDLRNHGDTGIFSKIPYASFGSFEHLDAIGGVDYLQERFPFLGNTSFGIFGTSMGGATALVAFAKDERFKAVFVDSPPCDVYNTLLFGARQLAGDFLARVAMATLQSVVPVKAPLLGFPPFHNDPLKLLSNINLSQERKMFFLHVEGDLVVPTFNFHSCLKAVNTSIQINNYPSSSIDSYLGTVNDHSTNSTRKYCNKHLSWQFVNLEHFYELLRNFFGHSL